MQLHYWGLALNAFIAFFAGAMCLSYRPFSKVDADYFYIALCVAFWSVMSAALQVYAPAGAGAVLWRLSILGPVALPLAFYNFTLDHSGRRKRHFRVLYAFIGITVFMAAAVMTPLFVKEGGVYGRLPGPAFWFLALFFAAGSVLGLKLLYERNLSIVGSGKREGEYLFYASIAMFAGVLLSLVSWYGGNLLLPGGFLASLGLAAGYAFTKYSAAQVRLTATRAGIFVMLYVLILGFPFWLGVTTERWKLSVLLMAVLASVGPFLYNMLGKKVENLMLAQQRRYQQILLEISQSMVKEHDLGKLVKFIVYAVKRAVKMKFAAIFVNSPDDKAYVLKASKDKGAMHPKFYFSYNHPLITYLKEHKMPVKIGDLPGTLDGFKEIDLGISLIVPSFVDERLVSFLLLGNKLDGNDYTQDDVNIFLTLSGQAALAIENCMYLKEFERAQEKIFNADKLASLGGMADGVAHQIKNRLNQFSVAAGEQQYEIAEFLEKHSRVVENNSDLKKTFEYLSEISRSMLENVRKTTNVIQGVLSFAREEEKGAAVAEFKLDEIIKPTTELLCVKHQISEFPLKVEGGETLPVYGIKSQIMECLYNLLDNSYEAIEERIDYHLKEKESLVPVITLKVSKQDRSSFIEITDNGIGIKEENMNKIFAPFFTTKSSFKSGSGVGMYVVKRMIEENHKGKIKVESEYMKGSRVVLELPDKH